MNAREKLNLLSILDGTKKSGSPEDSSYMGGRIGSADRQLLTFGRRSSPERLILGSGTKIKNKYEYTKLNPQKVIKDTSI